MWIRCRVNGCCASPGSTILVTSVRCERHHPLLCVVALASHSGSNPPTSYIHHCGRLVGGHQSIPFVFEDCPCVPWHHPLQHNCQCAVLLCWCHPSYPCSPLLRHRKMMHSGNKAEIIHVQPLSVTQWGRTSPKHPQCTVTCCTTHTLCAFPQQTGLLSLHGHSFWM